MIFTGVLVNFAAVVAGSLIGLFFKDKLKQRYHTALIDAIALGVAAIGASYTIKTQNILVMMVSLIIGTLAGTFLKINDRLDSFGERMKDRMKIAEGSFSEGFAGASILFCVGSMAILGCIESGLNNNHTILLTKSIMDGVTSIFLASALGAGVLFSAGSVLVYQGILVLLASLLSGLLGADAVNEMSAVGGVILLGIAVNMLGIKKIKAADMVLSLFLPIAVLPLIKLLS
jgi:uncharacterized membrane protein YqgA involved in biofilm formation